MIIANKFTNYRITNAAIRRYHLNKMSVENIYNSQVSVVLVHYTYGICELQQL